jgi:hypothetical protein
MTLSTYMDNFFFLKYGTNHDENLLELYGNIKEPYPWGQGHYIINFVTKKCSLLILNVRCNQTFITMLLDFGYYRIKHNFQYLWMQWILNSPIFNIIFFHHEKIMHKIIGKWRHLWNNKPCQWNWNIKILFLYVGWKKFKIVNVIFSIFTINVK